MYSVATFETTGISCSIAFQYYRPEPLSIAISWNTIFLVINGFMVALLIKERYDARQQDQETSNLYDQARCTCNMKHFGFASREFVFLRNSSRRGALNHPFFNTIMSILLISLEHHQPREIKICRIVIVFPPQVFRESGLTPVDFMKIIGISKTIKLAPGIHVDSSHRHINHLQVPLSLFISLYLSFYIYIHLTGQ